MELPSHLEKPRLCSLRKWSNFNGYGFNLHAEKGKIGQYIGKVDLNSPADAGGLKANDIVIEVNGINVEDATHQRVVEKVKSLPDKVDLFVSCSETYRYCREHNISLSSEMPCVERMETPLSNSINEDSVSPTKSVPVAASTVGGFEQKENQPISKKSNEFVANSSINNNSINNSNNTSVNASRNNNSSINATTDAINNNSNNSSSSSSRHRADDPIANISLEQMRAKIGSNKRNQVKMKPTSFNEKHNVFESL